MTILQRPRTPPFPPPAWQDRPNVFWIKEFGSSAVRARPPEPEPLPSATEQLVATTRPSEGSTTRQRLAVIARDYLDNAYVFGVALASRRNIHVCDRVLWVVIITLAAVLSIRELPLTYQRISEHPTTVEVRTATKSVYNIPFPAVTICPKMKVRKRAAIEHIIQVNRLPFLNESVVLPALQFLQSFRVPYWLDRRPLPIFNKTIYDLFRGIDLRDFMETVSLNCSSVFKRCFWSGEEVDCCSVFRPTASSTGRCFAFNSLTTLERRTKCSLVPFEERPTLSSTSVWYLNRPKTEECGLVKALGAGLHSALEVFLHYADPLDMVSPGPQSRGYEVAVQSPNEIADMGRGISMPETTNMMTTVSITYQESAADPWLRSLDTAERGCLFEEELPEIFQTVDQNWYTHDACLVVCRYMFLHKRCNCFPFLVTKRSQQCGLEDYQCIVQHGGGNLLWARVTSEDVPFASPEERNHSAWPDCRQCLPLCSLSMYKSTFSTVRSAYLPTIVSAAYLNVFYRDMHSAIKYTERREQEPNDQFLTYCSILNLFLGLSVMSVAQAAFYLAWVLAEVWGPARRRLAAFRDTWWRPPTARSSRSGNSSSSSLGQSRPGLELSAPGSNGLLPFVN